MRVKSLLAVLMLSASPALAAPVKAPVIPPVASLQDGIWLKGDLHLHSRHSKESSNNPVKKIIGFAERVGFDFIAITDHDNHVEGAAAEHRASTSQRVAVAPGSRSRPWVETFSSTRSAGVMPRPTGVAPRRSPPESRAVRWR